MIPPTNNFDTLRATAALSVIVSHAFPLTYGSGTLQPLHHLSHGQVDLGLLAVLVFFVISGYLIARSYDRSPLPMRFIEARFFRIFPGLLVALVSTALLLGPAITTLSLGEYFRHHDVPAYIFDCLTLFQVRFDLPGVFEGNPTSRTVNGSLWTLQYEFMLYLVVLALGMARLLRPWIVLGLWLGLLVLSWQWVGGIFVQFALPFMGGAILYLWRDRVPSDWRLVLASVVALGLTAQIGGFRLAFGVFGAYLVIFLAVSPSVRLPNLGRHGDLSYGIYIYGYPVQQTISYLLGPTSAWYSNVALSLPVTVGLAALSWHFVEKPALSLKRCGTGALLQPGRP